jgi:gamma-glutamylputrescine oxidase
LDEIVIWQQDVMQADDPTFAGAGWYGGAATPAPKWPRLTFDIDVDVCVIGGGLAGLTTAREIARRGWSVAVVEAQTVASGASGRNLGFVLPGFLEHLDRIIDRVGLDHARQLWALSERGLDYVRETIRDTGMSGVEPVDGWLSVAKFREDEKMKAEAKLLREEFGADVEAWSAERVQEKLRSPLYQNAIHFPRAFHINPVNYTRALAAAAVQAGARIFENTPALWLDPAGVRKRIGTPSARVRAGHVVLAGNTGLDAVMPRLAASLLPITTYVAVTAPLGEKLQEAVAYNGGVSDSVFPDSHYRIVGGDRLIWSGGMTMWVANPRRYARRLAADIRRAFPQLGRVAIEHVWSGTLGRAVHRMPQVGEIGRGVWLASGFGGHGFNTTAMAGELIARGIVEGDETWRLFAPYDLVWAGGKAGRAAAQALYWWHRMRERLDAQFSRPVAMRQDSAAAALPMTATETPATQHPAVPEAEAPTAETAPAAPVADGAIKTPQRRKRPAAKARAPKAEIAGEKPGSEVPLEAGNPLAAGRISAEN